MKKSTQLQKIMNVSNFADIVVNLIRDKKLSGEQAASMEKWNATNHEVTEFGVSSGSFSEMKMYNTVDLFPALTHFKVTFPLEEIEKFLSFTKKYANVRAISAVLVNKYKDLEKLKELLESFIKPKILYYEPKSADNHFVYNHYLTVLEQFALVKDDLQVKRVHLALLRPTTFLI